MDTGRLCLSKPLIYRYFFNKDLYNGNNITRNIVIEAELHLLRKIYFNIVLIQKLYVRFPYQKNILV